MAAGKMIDWRVPTLRGLDRSLRTARLLAAREYAPGSKPRHAILGGFWDGGEVVRRYAAKEGA